MNLKDYVVYAEKTYFVQIPVSAKNKAEAEAKAQKLIDEGNAYDYLENDPEYEIKEVQLS